MDTKIFTLPEGAVRKALIKLGLVLLGGLATYMESYLPSFFKEIIANPVIFTLVLSVNTALLDLLRKYLTDEEGKLGGVIKL